LGSRHERAVAQAAHAEGAALPFDRALGLSGVSGDGPLPKAVERLD